MQSLSMEERQKVLPSYTVTPLTREVMSTVAVKDELGFRTVQKKIEVEGYMVRTLRNDSIFVTHEELVRMKLDRNLVPMVVAGGDDAAVAMQENNPALSKDQRQALDVLMKLVEQNPSLVSQLLNAKADGGDKPAPADEEPEEEDEEDTELEKKDK
jgi:hypothetical protein